MAALRLFIPQEKLDAWTLDGHVQIGDQTLRVPGEQRELRLEPAVRFMSEVGGQGDVTGLVGRVKTIAQIEQMGADHYRDSVIVGDCAYQVVEGFCGSLEGASLPAEAPPLPRPDAEPAKAPAPAPAGGKAEEEISDAETLARLLIEKL